MICSRRYVSPLLRGFHLVSFGKTKWNEKKSKENLKNENNKNKKKLKTKQNEQNKKNEALRQK